MKLMTNRRQQTTPMYLTEYRIFPEQKRNKCLHVKQERPNEKRVEIDRVSNTDKAGVCIIGEITGEMCADNMHKIKKGNINYIERKILERWNKTIGKHFLYKKENLQYTKIWKDEKY